MNAPAAKSPWLNHADNHYARMMMESARTPDEYKMPPKIYYHHHNYARFHFDFGNSRVKSVSFASHRYITDDKREQDQLDLVADQPGTFIYTLPENEVSVAMMQELLQEQQKDVLRTAQASAGAAGQMFDPNTPIVPVQVQHVNPTLGLQVSPVAPQLGAQGAGVVGLANSFSGTQATEGLVAKPTLASEQKSAPSATTEAVARLAALEAAAKSSSTE